mgnify:CR=1 FL=1
MKRLIHVNQHIIKKNRKTVKTYKSNTYASEVTGDGPFRVVYRPDKPLPCGAQVWIESDGDVVVVR